MRVWRERFSTVVWLMEISCAVEPVIPSVKRPNKLPKARQAIHWPGNDTPLLARS